MNYKNLSPPMFQFNCIILLLGSILGFIHKMHQDEIKDTNRTAIGFLENYLWEQQSGNHRIVWDWNQITEFVTKYKDEVDHVA